MLVTVRVTGGELVCGEVPWCPGVIEPQAVSRAPLDVPKTCGTMPAHSASSKSLRNMLLLPIISEMNECIRISGLVAQQVLYQINAWWYIFGS